MVEKQQKKSGGGSPKSIANTGQRSLALPDGTVLPAGQSVTVPNWEQFEENETVQEWVDNGDIEVNEAKEEGGQGSASVRTDQEQIDKEIKEQQEIIDRTKNQGQGQKSGGAGKSGQPSKEEEERKRHEERERVRQQEQSKTK
jgi:hypothetical protein